MAETRLILIRHGETEWNRDGRIQGYHADSPLTANGRVQARRVAERLESERVEALYSSDAGRTRQTAAPIVAALGLDIVYDPALRERNYGEFEGRTYLEIEQDYPEEFRKLRARDPSYAPPEGESAAQFRDRIVAALERVAARAAGRQVAVITHGGVLGIAYRHATGMTLEAKRDYSMQNASINRLAYSSGRWLVEAWGDVAHLPPGSSDGPGTA